MCFGLFINNHIITKDDSKILNIPLIQFSLYIIILHIQPPRPPAETYYCTALDHVIKYERYDKWYNHFLI